MRYSTPEPMIDDRGQPVLDKNGKQKTTSIPWKGLGEVKYDGAETPELYACELCHKKGCRLWLQDQTPPGCFQLSCESCTAKVQQEGKANALLEPAIPTQTGASFWANRVAPADARAWWWRLPALDRAQEGQPADVGSPGRANRGCRLAREGRPRMSSRPFKARSSAPSRQPCRPDGSCRPFLCRSGGTRGRRPLAVGCRDRECR